MLSVKRTNFKFSTLLSLHCICWIVPSYVSNWKYSFYLAYIYYEICNTTWFFLGLFCLPKWIKSSDHTVEANWSPITFYICDEFNNVKWCFTRREASFVSYLLNVITTSAYVFIEYWKITIFVIATWHSFSFFKNFFRIGQRQLHFSGQTIWRLSTLCKLYHLKAKGPSIKYVRFRE